MTTWSAPSSWAGRPGAELNGIPSLAGVVFGPEYLKIGILTGLAYGVLGAGLILVYRATRVITFAHAQIGAFAATLFAKLVLDEHWNFFLAAAAMLVLGGLIGAAVELLVIRRLFTAPRLVLLVATIGVAQLLLLAQLLVAHIDNYDQPFPVGLDLATRVGGVLVRGEDLMIAAVVPLLVGALWWLLTRTRYGLDIRACAENPDAARLEGVRIRRVSTLVWALAGVLAAATAILTSPYTVILNLPQQALDPSLLLKALAAAMVGRLASVPLTLAGGIGVGVGEALIRANVANPDVVDIALFVAVVALVLVRARGISESTGGYDLAPRVRLLPAGGGGPPWLRRLPLLAGVAGLLVALLLPSLFPSPSRIFLFSEVLIYALVALSITVLTGWAGQLSLGQFGFVGLGASATAGLSLHGVPFAAAAGLATLLGVAAAVLVGLPALRVRGLFLSITTLAFGSAVIGLSALLLGNHVLSDSALMSVPRPVVLGFDLGDQRNYYLLCLGVLALAVPAVSRLRRGGIGRTLIAVRDNQANAAAFTVSPTIAKLSAFGVSGGLAAVAGALLAGLVVNFDQGLFSMDESLRVLAIAVIGGLGSVAGSVLGAVYVLGLPALFNNAAEATLLTSSAGLLLVLMYLPGGFAGVLQHLRDQLLLVVDRRRSPPATPPPAPARAASRRETAPPQAGALALRVRDVRADFDGRPVLDGIDLEAGGGEVVGLIGTNGAGKTTLMNVISGLVPAKSGLVELAGEDVGGLPPHQRARRGLGRAFQDARLFAGLSLLECVEVALEARERSELVPSLLALPPSVRGEHRKLAEAGDIVAFLGLGRYAGAAVTELSTGTRRIAELACLVALGARVLLLDEPTAGIAQREAEAFGPLILSVQAELGATLVIIEHDIPLLLSISHRVYCLEAGRVIAEGPPEAVRTDPRVISSYLGCDNRVIQRSGAAGRPS